MEGSNSKHIILVHGACHGAWCWYKVATLLRSAGYRVTMPDLAASGIDRRCLREVPTFTDYTRPLLDILQSLPPEEKVILVGHSLGGLNIALATDMFPQKITVVVFVAAFMPDCKFPPSYVLDKFIEGNWVSWLDTELKPQDGEGKLPTSMFFGPQFCQEKLYQLCSPEDVTVGKTLVRPSSLFVEDLKLQPAFSKNRYGSVDAVYVICGQDLAIPVKFQRWTIENNPVKEVKEIDVADHMVMLSAPKVLFQCLADIADSYA